jgi:hypothetical protein
MLPQPTKNNHSDNAETLSSCERLCKHIVKVVLALKLLKPRYGVPDCRHSIVSDGRDISSADVQRERLPRIDRAGRRFVQTKNGARKGPVSIPSIELRKLT